MVLVGESGCGKSVTSLAIAGLLPENASANGTITLDGRNLSALSKEEMRQVRLKDIAQVFQDPMTYLNPVFQVGTQITEALISEREFYRNQMIEDRLRDIEGHDKRGDRDLQGLQNRREQSSKIPVRTRASLANEKLGHLQEKLPWNT